MVVEAEGTLLAPEALFEEEEALFLADCATLLPADPADPADPAEPVVPVVLGGRSSALPLGILSEATSKVPLCSAAYGAGDILADADCAD